MLDTIYSLPTWVLGVLVVGLAAAVSGLGLLVVHRFVPTEVRRAHNDIAGYVSNIAAFVYAVMLAFLAVGVWEDYGKAQLTVSARPPRPATCSAPRRGTPRPSGNACGRASAPISTSSSERNGRCRPATV
jgi:hypothetical protein